MIPTRRERLKSAPYLRLKKLKFLEIVKGGTLWVFSKSNLLRGVTSQRSDIVCWENGRACFRTSTSSLVKQNVIRIQRQKFGYSALLHITSKFRVVFKKIIGGYILKKPNFRQKMTILNSLIVQKNLKEGTLWDFYISIMLQNILKIEGGTISRH